MIHRPAYRIMAGALLGVALAGCAERSERMFFAGNYYPPRTDEDRDDRRNFTASVKRVDQGVEGAREAVLHEARRYCVTNYGTSDIAWAQGPDGREGPAFAVSGGRMTVTGRCVIWK